MTIAASNGGNRAIADVMITSDAVGDSPGIIRPAPRRSICSIADGAELITPTIHPAAMTQKTLLINDYCLMSVFGFFTWISSHASQRAQRSRSL